MNHQFQEESIACQQFLAVRARCDGRTIATTTVSSPFCRRLLQVARDRFLWNFDSQKREEIEAIALESLCRYFEKTGGIHFHSQDGPSFRRFLARACRRHIEWGCCRWLRERKVAERHRLRALLAYRNHCHYRPGDGLSPGFLAKGAALIGDKIAAWPEALARHRAALVLVLEGCPDKIAAARMGWCVKTLRKYQCQGRRLLAEELHGELALR